MLARLISIRALAASLAALCALANGRWAQAQEESESDVEEEAGSEDAAKVDPNQPAVTSGGRYTIVNYPLSEFERTLLLVDGVLELRADIDILMTKGQTFDYWSIFLGGRYGIGDTLELQAAVGFQAVVPDMVDRAIAVAAGVEGSIMYDLVDWRAGVVVPLAPGDATVDLVFGLPLKFRILKDRVAILALDDIITIHTKSIPKATMSDPNHKSLQKPDLTISVGALVQILKQLCVIVRAEIESVGFEGDLVVPVELNLQYTINNRMDVGATLRLLNLNKSEAMTATGGGTSIESLGRFDQRSVAIFFRLRI